MVVQLFQVVYCVEIGDSYDYWLKYWFLLKCPIVCFDSLKDARRIAGEWKDRLGEVFQPVIIGQTDGDFEGIDCDNLFGVSAIAGLDASEEDFPDSLFDDEEEMMVFA